MRRFFGSSFFLGTFGGDFLLRLLGSSVLRKLDMGLLRGRLAGDISSPLLAVISSFGS
jgi:hypothetical protein